MHICNAKLYQFNVFSVCFVDVRLRKLAEEKDELLAQIRKLKNQLEEERQKHSKVDSAFTDGERMENGTDLHFIEMQSKYGLVIIHEHTLNLLNICLFCQTHWFLFFFEGDANRQISEYKFKLSKAEQEMGTMEQNVSTKRNVELNNNLH